MILGWKRFLGAAGMAAAVVAGGSAALAAMRQDAPQSAVQAFVEDVASHLGVQPAALQGAVQAAELDQVDRALSSGRITQQQANRLKRRIESGHAGPWVLGAFGFGRFGHRMAVPVRGQAAQFLGLTRQQLQVDLRSGQSLAQIAAVQGKSAQDLEQTLLTQVKARLDKAVAAGRLTSAQEQRQLDRVRQRLDRLVQRAWKGRPGRSPWVQGSPAPGSASAAAPPSGSASVSPAAPASGT